MRVAIYTAIFGGYDDLQRHPAIPGVDFFAISDREQLHSDGWTVVRVDDDGRHPRIQAKEAKLLPHRFLPDHDASIWIDGSHEILTPHFADEILAALTGDIALYEHPWRSCIYSEASASLGEQPKKYAGLPILDQVAAYREEGHPADWGLWATGTIARRHTPDVERLMDAWWAEIERWTYQDQLSFPVVCRRAGVRPTPFPRHQIFGNPWTAIRSHHRED